MNTQQTINEFKKYQKDNASAIKLLIGSDNTAKQYYEGIKEATENFTDFDPEILEATDFDKVMERFNAKMKPYISQKKAEAPTVGIYTMPKSEPKAKFSEGTRVKNIKDGKIGTVESVRDTDGIEYSIRWDKNPRIMQAGVKEALLKKYTTAKAKTAAKASAKVKKAKASRKANAKPRPKTQKADPEKPKSTARAKTAAKANATVKKAKASRKAGAKAKVKAEVPKKPMPKVTVKAKTAKEKPQQKPLTKTHIETAEHKQIKRFLAIRKRETLQLAMTAYKGLQKDVTEKKIRAASPQATIIKAIQKSYYKYLMRETSSLMMDEVNLKAANEFVGSQKPYETVALVKRFIGWTGQSKTEKQITDYLKDAEKVAKDAKENDPYYDELKSIIKTLKGAKAGDVIIADSVGLSGLRANTIKVRK